MSLTWYKIAQVTPPTEAYHVTYLSRLNNINNRGLFLPQNMPLNWRTTRVSEDRIYLFVNPNDVAKVANQISLNMDRDWVLLKVTNLDPQFLTNDGDWGETWQESIQNYGTFGYLKPIPPSDIIPVRYAKRTPYERHDSFEN